jgi:hypothetical protein
VAGCGSECGDLCVREEGGGLSWGIITHMQPYTHTHTHTHTHEQVGTLEEGLVVFASAVASSIEVGYSQIEYQLESIETAARRLPGPSQPKTQNPPEPKPQTPNPESLRLGSSLKPL